MSGGRGPGLVGWLVIISVAAIVFSTAVAVRSSGTAADAGTANPAQARSWAIESFDADIRVFRSGDVAVTETISPRFQGSWNGIYRLIPVEYRTPGLGFEYDLRLSVEEVTDGAGNQLRHEVSRERHYKKIKVWIPGARDATRTVRITYRAKRAIRFQEGDEVTPAYDELYWNVTGDEWPVPIEAARAVVHLPPEATGLRARAWTGPYGSTEQAADVRIDGSRIVVEAARSLGYREGMTIAVAWDPGIIERPTAADEVRWFLLANWPLLFPFVAFCLMYRHWAKRGRDPEIRPVAPRYEPPEGLTPAEIGVVADNSADMRDLTATIVDLAVRGYLVIEETEEEKLWGLLKDRDYTIRLVKPRQEWDLLPHERKLLDALLDHGTDDRSVRLSDLENEFYKDLPDLKSRLMQTLVKHGIYRKRPDKVVGVYIGLAVLAAGVIVAIGLGLGEALGLAKATVVVSALGTGGVMAGFAVIMPARTRKGARTLEEVRGFEEFLERVEEDRFKRMITSPEMFERLLPFAMALKLEKRWADAFADIYREPPSWYVGGHYDAFHPRILVSDLGRMTEQAGTAMQSAPRSSGGSGFGGGGGGFSGGGGGGGGGGAF